MGETEASQTNNSQEGLQHQANLEEAKTSQEKREAMISEIKSKITSLRLLIEFQAKNLGTTNASLETKIQTKRDEISTLLDQLSQFPEEQIDLTNLENLSSSKVRVMIMEFVKNSIGTYNLYSDLFNVMPENESELSNQMNNIKNRIEPITKMLYQYPEDLALMPPEAPLTDAEREDYESFQRKLQSSEIYMLNDLIKIFPDQEEKLNTLISAKRIFKESLSPKLR